MPEPPPGGADPWAAPEPGHRSTYPPTDRPTDEPGPEPEPVRDYRRLSPLTPLVRSSLLVVAALASSWDDLLRGDIGPLAWILLATLLAGAVYGAASWLRTKYWIEADELRVDTGVLSRQSRRIRVDRLQGIDIKQPFVARLFGLAELKMDVAGGGRGEGSLAFLPLREAQELREALMRRRDAVRARRPGTPAPEAGSPAWLAELPAPPRPEQVVARLDLRMLLVSLLWSWETVVFLVVAVVLGVLLQRFGQFGGILGVLPAVLGLVAAQARKLSAYYGFTVVDTEAGLQVRRGLLERVNQTVAVARVQGVVVREPWLWRRLGWARLDVSLAGSIFGNGDGDGGPSSSTVMPVGRRDLVMGLARRLLESAGGPDPDAVRLSPPPERARWAAPVRWRFLAGGVGDDLVVSRKGVLTRRTHVVPHARVQSLRVLQGPWQRRLGLADVEVDSPPGAVEVRFEHRDAAEARALLEEEHQRAKGARTTGDGVR